MFVRKASVKIAKAMSVKMNARTGISVEAESAGKAITNVKVKCALSVISLYSHN